MGGAFVRNAVAATEAELTPEEPSVVSTPLLPRVNEMAPFRAAVQATEDTVEGGRGRKADLGIDVVAAMGGYRVGG